MEVKEHTQLNLSHICDVIYLIFIPIFFFIRLALYFVLPTKITILLII